MTAPCRHHRDAGFTLIELIVALAILALLASMFPGAFAVGQRAWETVRRVERLDADAAARAFVEQRLMEALPVRVADAGGVRHSGFRGEARRISFIAPSASGPAGGGLYQYVLSGERTGDRDALVLVQRPVSAAASLAPADAPRVLREGLAGLRFRYFGRHDDDQERRWHDGWPDGDRLPELVEIGETGGTGVRGGVAFRPLLVPLKLRRPD